MRKPSSEAAISAISIRRALGTACFWLLPPLLVLLTYRRVSGFEFVADARFLIESNTTLRDLGSWCAQLTHDYFWSSSGNTIPYWRPVTKLFWLLEYQWFGQWAGGYLWVQVAMHALTVSGVQLLARQLGLRRPFALIAALLAAVHPVAIEPVALIMARSDVAAVCFGLWSLIAWLHWRARLAASARAAELACFGALHTVLLALSLGSKEAALGWVALILVWGALHGDLARGHRRRALLALPAVTLSIAYLIARRLLLAREATGLAALHLGFDPLRVLSSLALYLRNLLPVLESSVRNLSFAEARAPETLVMAGLTLLATALLAALLIKKRDLPALALLIGTLLLLFPVLLTLEISVPQADRKFPLADRWLYHALPCASIVLARSFELASKKLKSSLVNVTLGLALSTWCVLLLVHSARATEEMGSELKMLDNEDRLFYFAVPAEFRSHEDDCAFQERKLVRGLLLGKPELTLALSPDALRVCGERATIKQHLLEAYVKLERFPEALPLARELEQAPPLDGRAQGRLDLNIGLTLFHSGDKPGAERWLARAARRGYGGCQTLLQLGEAARARGDVNAAAGRLEAAFFCAGQRDPSLLIAAATWLADAGEQEHAQRLLKVSRVYRLSPDQAAQADRLEAALGQR